MSSLIAIKCLLEEVRTLGGKRLQTSRHPENTCAAHLYPKLGFQPIGELDDGDLLYELAST